MSQSSIQSLWYACKHGRNLIWSPTSKSIIQIAHLQHTHYTYIYIHTACISISVSNYSKLKHRKSEKGKYFQEICWSPYILGNTSVAESDAVKGFEFVNVISCQSVCTFRNARRLLVCKMKYFLYNYWYI